MKIKFFIIFAIIFLTAGSFVSADIQYPVEELGNCKDKADCKAYCDKPKNTEDCFAFAEENNLMSKEEIKVAEKFLSGDIEGPGDCATKEACEEYCDNISHIDECIAFAEENNLIPPEELEEAKRVQAAIKRGVMPPPCGNKRACDIYCEDPEHMEECIAFGLEAGFIQGKELEDAQKMLQAVKRGVKPPPCKGKKACDEYCSNPDNMETCMNFAMEAGFMSEEEKAGAQGMLQAIKKGVKPPPCKGREECDAYCQQEGHMEVCINFSVAAGMMSEEDAKMAKKTGGKGPGGCKGKEECDAFCNNPDNQETCFNFAKDNGMIPEEDLKRMEEGKQQMKQSLEQAPTEVLECLEGEIGSATVEKMRSGFMPPQDVGEKMQGCFQKMRPPEQQCQGENCERFQPGPGVENPGGQMMPQQAGPGGCKTPEECSAYCQSNPENCKNFYPAGDESLRGPEQGQPNEQQGLPCQGENCQMRPLPGQPMQPGQEFQPLPPEQNIQQPAPNENPPPPPPPPPPVSSFFKPQSFLGSVLYLIAKPLYSLR